MLGQTFNWTNLLVECLLTLLHVFLERDVCGDKDVLQLVYFRSRTFIWKSDQLECYNNNNNNNNNNSNNNNNGNNNKDSNTYVEWFTF